MVQADGISIAEARSILGHALEALICGDLRAIDLFVEDVGGDSPNMCVRTRDELANQMLDRVGAFSNVEFAIDRLERVDQEFVASWHMSGVHTGAVLLNEDEFFEASGLPIELSATTHVAFRGRRIAAFRTAYDGSDPFELLRRRPTTGPP
jgi:hypothetical protein